MKLKYIDIKTYFPPLGSQLSLSTDGSVSTYRIEMWGIKLRCTAWCLGTMALEDGRRQERGQCTWPGRYREPSALLHSDPALACEVTCQGIRPRQRGKMHSFLQSNQVWGHLWRIKWCLRSFAWFMSTLNFMSLHSVCALTAKTQPYPASLPQWAWSALGSSVESGQKHWFLYYRTLLPQSLCLKRVNRI